MPEQITLSQAAALLLRHVEQGELPVDDANREPHRALARAGLMVAVHTFSGAVGRRFLYCHDGGGVGA